MRNAKPYHSKIYHSCHSDTLRHSELRSSEESHSIRHSEDFPPCHSDLEQSEREESQNTESKKESESTKDKYDFQR